MPRFSVNTKEVIKFSKKLERISKNALPRATRNTLNELAFDTKKRTLPQEFDKAFTVRKKAFPRAFSRVETAKSLKINQMEAVVGMTNKGRRGVEQAGENMRQQQLGGRIKGRTLVPHDMARVGGKNQRNVRVENRVSNVKVQLKSRISRHGKAKQRFIRTATHALERFGSTAVIMHTTRARKTFIYRVKRGGSDLRTDDFNIKVTPLYSVKKGRSVNIKDPVTFTRRAALRSQKQANRVFRKHAKKRIERGF